MDNPRGLCFQVLLGARFHIPLRGLSIFQVTPVLLVSVLCPLEFLKLG